MACEYYWPFETVDYFLAPQNRTYFRVIAAYFFVNTMGDLMRKFVIVMALIAVFGVVAGPNIAQAAGVAQGTVTRVTILPAGYALFELSVGPTGAPSCASTQRWALNTSTLGGQAALATILTAYAQGKAVAVMGTGVCDVYPGSETVNYFYTV